MTVQLDEHSRLERIIADILHVGLDAARVRIGPRAEREVIAAAVEVLELAGYTITRADIPPTVAAVGDNATNEGVR